MKFYHWAIVLFFATTISCFAKGRQNNNQQNSEALIAGMNSLSIFHQGKIRTFHVYVPEGIISSSQKHPLLFVFHGGHPFTNGLRMIDLGFNAKADQDLFYVVYPDGVGGFWNDGRGITPSEIDGIDDVAFVRTIKRKLKRKWSLSIDNKKIYATGISNGGMFTYRLACEASGFIKAIAPVIANMPIPIYDTCNPNKQIHILTINGTNDPLIPFEGGNCCDSIVGRDGGSVASFEQSIQIFVEKNGCSGEFHDFRKPIHVDDGTSVQHRIYFGCNKKVQSYIVEGGGHAWYPLDPRKPWLAGNTSKNLNNTNVIWNFFRNLKNMEEFQPQLALQPIVENDVIAVIPQLQSLSSNGENEGITDNADELIFPNSHITPTIDGGDSLGDFMQNAAIDYAQDFVVSFTFDTVSAMAFGVAPASAPVTMAGIAASAGLLFAGVIASWVSQGLMNAAFGPDTSAHARVVLFVNDDGSIGYEVTSETSNFVGNPEYYIEPIITALNAHSIYTYISMQHLNEQFFPPEGIPLALDLDGKIVYLHPFNVSQDLVDGEVSITLNSGSHWVDAEHGNFRAQPTSIFVNTINVFYNSYKKLPANPPDYNWGLIGGVHDGAEGWIPDEESFEGGQH